MFGRHRSHRLWYTSRLPSVAHPELTHRVCCRAQARPAQKGVRILLLRHEETSGSLYCSTCTLPVSLLHTHSPQFTGDRDVKGPGDFDGTGPAELGDDDDAEGDEDMTPNDNEDSQTTPPAQAGPSVRTSFPTVCVYTHKSFCLYSGYHLIHLWSQPRSNEGQCQSFSTCSSGRP
jgi:hypothetical protein